VGHLRQRHESRFAGTVRQVISGCASTSRSGRASR
jgi:hypothetical protein